MISIILLTTIFYSGISLGNSIYYDHKHECISELYHSHRQFFAGGVETSTLKVVMQHYSEEVTPCKTAGTELDIEGGKFECQGTEFDFLREGTYARLSCPAKFNVSDDKRLKTLSTLNNISEVSSGGPHILSHYKECVTDKFKYGHIRFTTGFVKLSELDYFIEYFKAEPCKNQGVEFEIDHTKFICQGTELQETSNENIVKVHCPATVKGIENFERKRETKSETTSLND